jgi:hypothetical protein
MIVWPLKSVLKRTRRFPTSRSIPHECGPIE